MKKDNKDGSKSKTRNQNKKKLNEVYNIINYFMGITAYKHPDENKWEYAVTFFCNKEDKSDYANLHQTFNGDELCNCSPVGDVYFEFFGPELYNTYQDALQTGFSVMETMGFCQSGTRICMLVKDWDTETERYKDDKFVYFDGFDFFLSGAKIKKT